MARTKLVHAEGSDLLEEIAKLNALKEELATKLRDQGAKAISPSFVKYFEKHPDVNAIRWTQYTPYFNDGDPCTFRTGDAELRLENYSEDAQEDAIDDDDDGFRRHYSADHPESVRAAFKDVDKLLGKIGDEALEIIFGDHVEVYVTRGGFEVREYNHD